MTDDLKYTTTWTASLSREIMVLPPEDVDERSIAMLHSLLNLIGTITISRVDAEDHSDHQYFIRYPENLTIREDGHWSGPDSICFFGPGGGGSGLSQMLEREIEFFGYYAGCIICQPPKGIYGPVRASARIDLYGKPNPAIDRAEDLKLAMDHALGRIPPDWPATTNLEPIAA